LKNALALVSHPTALNVDEGYLASQQRSRARSGESRLMLALLQDGIFSFDSVCETLGVSASCLRAKIRQWKEEELQKGALKAGSRPPARKRLSPLPRSYSSPGKLTATARA
jgi:hypothetical protein